MEVDGFSFFPGNKVILVDGNLAVAFGEVVSSDASDPCHGVKIGKNRIKVTILNALLDTCKLPFPSMGADIVKEPIGTFVIWNMVVAKVVVKTLVPSSSTLPPISTTPVGDEDGVCVFEGVDICGGDVKELLENHGCFQSDGFTSTLGASSSATTSTCLAIVPVGEAVPNSYSGEMREEELLHFKIQKNWSDVLITLLSSSEAIPIVEGIIFLPFADSSISGELVGEAFAGVLVTKVICGVDQKNLLAELPTFYEGHLVLKRWPILQIQLQLNGRVLGDLYEVYEIVDYEINQMRTEDVPMLMWKKISYHNLKRKKMDLELKKEQELQKKVMRKLTEENITNDLKKGFCAPKNVA